ncbi:MAG: type II secretion system minor pseudopilin GspK [Candidatus Omnitrophota bacterium]|nr:type II secretion system minor pseudopilin GspK [Candidatus Omnitrophota bacterium]
MNKGVILIVTLWILVILTLFALSMGRSVNMDLLLTRYSVDKLKSYFVAKAGIVFAVARLEKDSQDNQAREFDSIYQCGVSLKEQESPENIFKEIAQPDGSFTIGYALVQDENNQPRIIYGLEDEERRLNLNAINAQNYKALLNLMLFFEIDREAAETISASVADWRDSDSVTTDAGYGAEDSYYTALESSYHCQNTNFQSLEELLLVRGVNKEIFQKIKNYITIFPKQINFLQVNVNTVEEPVLFALANSWANVDKTDADNLAQKIIDYRKGNDNIIATADDRFVELNNPESERRLNLNQPETTLFANLRNSNFFIAQSNYFRVNAQATFKDKKIKSQILAIVERGNPFPLFWHED